MMYMQESKSHSLSVYCIPCIYLGVQMVDENLKKTDQLIKQCNF